MTIIEDLQTQFEALNVIVDPRALEKCEQLCTTYNIEAEDFIDQWLAYTASNLNGEPPSLDSLNRLERKELMKLGKPNISGPGTSHSVVVTRVSPVKEYVHKEMIDEPPVVSETLDNLPSQRFINRPNPCSVLYEFGESKGTEFTKRRPNTLVIRTKNGPADNNRKYMCEKFMLKQNAINAACAHTINNILNFHKLEMTKTKLKQHSGEMVIAGKLRTQNSAKLEPGSILIEGLPEIYKGEHVKLDIKSLNNVSLFSGQNVVVKGNNFGNCFFAKEMYTGAPVPHVNTAKTAPGNLQILIAAGPFTLPENLLYEPLEQLLKYASDIRPNVLILMGPFIERTHVLIETISDSYDDFFENIVAGIMDRLQDVDVKVVLVPSHKDVHNHIVFPTFPYTLRKRFDHLHLAPNPFVLDIEGLTIGGLTADVLFHLSKAEYVQFKQQPASRIDRLLGHVFNQRCFYPLSPPDSDVLIDYQLIEKYGLFDEAPHVMVLPSTLKYFVKTVEDCVVINPERSIKGNNAGTFALIEVREAAEGVKMCERVSCRIYNL